MPTDTPALSFTGPHELCGKPKNNRSVLLDFSKDKVVFWISNPMRNCGAEKAEILCVRGYFRFPSEQKNLISLRPSLTTYPCGLLFTVQRNSRSASQPANMSLIKSTVPKMRATARLAESCDVTGQDLRPSTCWLRRWQREHEWKLGDGRDSFLCSVSTAVCSKIQRLLLIIATWGGKKRKRQSYWPMTKKVGSGSVTGRGRKHRIGCTDKHEDHTHKRRQAQTRIYYGLRSISFTHI